jgi:FkbM family methyltransferase
LLLDVFKDPARRARILDRLSLEARRYSTGDPSARRLIREQWQREAFFRAAGRFSPVLAATWPAGRFAVSTADRDVGRETFVSGPYGERDAALACRRLREELGSKFRIEHGLVLEVGANIGTTTVVFATVCGAAGVVAFEPSPRNFELLRHNVILNDLEQRVTAQPIAISDSGGHAAFELSPRNSGDNRVRPPGYEPGGAFDENSRAVIDVELRTIDELVADGTIPIENVALMWIDTQGHEAHVLAGARSVTDRKIPVVIEYWPYGLERVSACERLHDVVADAFTHFINLDERLNPSLAVAKVDELERLRSSYWRADEATNLALLTLS